MFANCDKPGMLTRNSFFEENFFLNLFSAAKGKGSAMKTKWETCS